MSTALGFNVAIRYCTLFAAATVFVLTIPIAFSAEPFVKRIVPAGVSAGTTQTLKITGDRLDDTTGLLFYQSGLKATNIEVVNAKEINVQIESDKDLNNDLYAFRLVSKTGLSNMRLLGVNRFPASTEVEPNSQFEAPQAVSINTTIDGTITSEDVDLFVVQLEAGQTLAVELEGLRLASEQNFFDPYIAILDSERFEVASSDDAMLLLQDCYCSFNAKEAGQYLIAVRESSFGGNDDCLYRLHISDQTRPVSILPAGGRPGQIVQATLIDDVGNSWTEEIKLPDEETPRFKVWSARDGAQAASPNYVCVASMDNYIEAEPNDSLVELVTLGEPPMALHGVLQSVGDTDNFIFTAKKDQQLQIRSLTRSLMRSPLDSVISIRDRKGRQLAGNDDTGGPDSSIDFKVPEDGEYVVTVRDHLKRGGFDFAYRVEVAAKSPEVYATIEEQERYKSQSIIVPRGSRFAIEAKINRRNVGGAATLSAVGLPTGVTAQAVAVDKDVSNIPVIFSAAADAPLGATLIGLVTTMERAGRDALVGNLQQHTQLIRGQNNRDVWGFDSDHVVVAVVEEAPFEIEVIEPKVPLVRDGSLDLTVKLTRKEGFDRSVRVRLLNNASGMSSSRSVKFEKDQTEVVIPITANGNAKTGKWPMTVLASSNIDKGNITIASEIFQIEIAEQPFQFAFNKVMAEQGKQIAVAIGVKQTRPTDGKVEVEMVGLPPGTTSSNSKQLVDPAKEELVFLLDVPADAKPGSFKTIVARGTITSDAGVITQTNGTGEVQIDVPVVIAAKPETAPAALETKPAAETVKPLTRLEQLRAMQNANATP